MKRRYLTVVMWMQIEAPRLVMSNHPQLIAQSNNQSRIVRLGKFEDEDGIG
jgi:hypothetical protein